MDAIGFALGTAFLASVFTVFGVVDRFVAGVAAEIRYSVAPAMVSGVRAWGREREAERGSSVAGRDVDGAGGPPQTPVRDRGEPGLEVPIQAVPQRGQRGWHLFGRLMRAMLAIRRRRTGSALGG